MNLRQLLFMLDINQLLSGFKTLQYFILQGFLFDAMSFIFSNLHFEWQFGRANDTAFDVFTLKHIVLNKLDYSRYLK